MEEEESLVLRSLSEKKHNFDSIDRGYNSFLESNENAVAASGIESSNNSLTHHAINMVVEVTTNFANFSFNDSSKVVPIGTPSNLADYTNATSIQNDNNNYWALFALVLVVGTAAGNILVCLAIAWERRLQNVTNYFLMSLAITDLMVAILVMPFGILTLVKGECIIIILLLINSLSGRISICMNAFSGELLHFELRVKYYSVTFGWIDLSGTSRSSQLALKHILKCDSVG